MSQTTCPPRFVMYTPDIILEKSTPQKNATRKSGASFKQMFGISPKQ